MKYWLSMYTISPAASRSLMSLLLLAALRKYSLRTVRA